MQQGTDYIELDVQRTLDGVPVIIHDATLDRTARGSASACSGTVREKTLAQLKTCDVGSWFNDANPSLALGEFVGLRIPTLEEIFVRYGGSTRFYLETKDPDLHPGIEADIVALLKKYSISAGTEELPRVYVQSFSAGSLMTMHALDASIPLVQLFGATTASGVIAQLDQVKSYAAAIGPSTIDVTPALVDAAHLRCILVHPYVVDDEAAMLSLLAMRVNGIFTDRPDLLRARVGGSTARSGITGCTAAH